MNIHAPAFSRRRFLRTLGQGALLASLPGPLWADAADVVTISILHTTDLHGHILPTTDYNDHPDLGGLARCATQVRQWQRANANSLLLDIGDVYQGTELGLHTRGATMIRCLNALAYDAWVVGNHEFDWGLDVLSDCVGLSCMPVLSGNAMVDGKAVGKIAPASGPLAKLRPWLIKEVAGFRLAIIGLTTPALSTWLPPENLRGFEMLDPVESLRSILREVSVQKPDAILLAGHMGLKRRDDEANRVGALTAQFPQLAVYLGGHTHQNYSSERVNNVLYTQADHYGIYAGKVDLTFDRASRRQLLHREAITVPMDRQIAFDPVVLFAGKKPRTRCLGPDHGRKKSGDRPRRLAVASAFRQAERCRAPHRQQRSWRRLHKQGVEVDVVVHGLFDEKNPLVAGNENRGGCVGRSSLRERYCDH